MLRVQKRHLEECYLLLSSFHMAAAAKLIHSSINVTYVAIVTDALYK